MGVMINLSENVCLPSVKMHQNVENTGRRGIFALPLNWGMGAWVGAWVGISLWATHFCKIFFFVEIFHPPTPTLLPFLIFLNYTYSQPQPLKL